MAWEPSLMRADKSSLGLPEKVRNAISVHFPSTTWQLGPDGLEWIKGMEQLGSAITGEFREMMLQKQADWEGLYDTPAVSVQFSISSGDAVLFVLINSHGDHAEAQRRLRSIATENGWVLEGDFEGG